MIAISFMDVYGNWVDEYISSWSTLTGVIHPPISWGWWNAWNVRFDVAPYLPAGYEPYFHVTWPLTGWIVWTFSGVFWLENVGWVTFDHNVSNSQATLICPSYSTGSCQVSGYAWNINAGWILLWPISGFSWVTYDPIEWKMHGHAWSVNLGWIPFEWDEQDGVFFCIRPPQISIWTWWVTDESFDVTVDTCNTRWGTWILTIWPQYLMGTGAEMQIFSTSSVIPIFANVDLSIATSYRYELIDPYNAITRWWFDVYANEPSEILTGWSISSLLPGNKLHQYCSTLSHLPSDNCIDGWILYPTRYEWLTGWVLIWKKVADNLTYFPYTLLLRDKYGNPVITIPWVKEVSIWFDILSTIDFFQIPIFSEWPTFSGAFDYDFWDALFVNLSWTTQSYNIFTSPWISIFPQSIKHAFGINISSFAPTSIWNTWSLKRFSYMVDGIFWSTSWEIDITHKYNTGNLLFIPAADIVFLSGSSVNLWSYLFVTGWIQSNTTKTLTGFSSIHGLSLSWVNNHLAIYRDPIDFDGWNVGCLANALTATWYIWHCTKWWMDISLVEIWNSTIFPLQYWTHFFRIYFVQKSATSLFPVPPYSTNYYSTISYYLDGMKVVFPSFRMAWVGTLSWSSSSWNAVGDTVKIIGNANGESVYHTVEGDDINRLSTLSWADLRNNIKKNVELLSRSITDTTNLDYEIIKTCPGTFITLPVIFSKKSYITLGCDIVINSDVWGNIGIISLKDESWRGGNIWIDKDVKNMAAFLYSDNAVFAGNGMTYYGWYMTNAPEKQNQLYIHWSLFSQNTIGGSAQISAPVCPGGVQPCTVDIALRYDYNHFRPGFWWLSSIQKASHKSNLSVGANAYSGFSMIIEYNTALLNSPPPGFKNIAN